MAAAWSHTNPSLVVEASVFQDLCSFSGLPFLRCRRVMERVPLGRHRSCIGKSAITHRSLLPNFFLLLGGEPSRSRDKSSTTRCLWLAEASTSTHNWSSGLFNRDESVAGASFVLGSRWRPRPKSRAVAGRSGGGLHEDHPVRALNYFKKSLTSGVAKGYISTHRGTGTRDRRCLR